MAFGPKYFVMPKVDNLNGDAERKEEIKSKQRNMSRINKLVRILRSAKQRRNPLHTKNQFKRMFNVYTEYGARAPSALYCWFALCDGD